MRRFSFYWILLAIAVSGLAACSGATAEEYLQRALAYRDEGQINSAVIELKNALQKNPQFGEARLTLGELYLQLGDFDEALKELDRALDLGISPERVLPPLLETKVDLGRSQEVLGALQSVALTARLRGVRGEALLAAGDVDGGRAELEAAIAEDATLPRPYVALAQVALTGPVPDVDGAVAMLTKGTLAAPSDRRLWLALGELELNQGQAIPAQTAFEKAQALPGNNLLPELGLVRIRIMQNDVEGAEDLLNGVLKRAPKHPLALHLKGVIALYKHDLGTAEQALQAVLSVAPDFPASLLALANVKHAQGQINQAEALLRHYIALDPENVPARKALAAMLLEDKKPTDAIDALAPVAAQLTDGKDLAILGIAYLQAGKPSEASRYLEAAADALPESAPQFKTQLALSLAAAGDNAGALAALGDVVPTAAIATQSEVLKVYLNLRKGDTDAALATANRLVASGSDPAVAYNALGLVRLARKDPAAARTAFDAALKADAKFGVAAVNLARLDQSDGKPADARKRLESVLAADPSDPDVLLALAQLVTASGEVDKAAAYLEQARQADPNALPPRIALARLSLGKGDLKTADAVSAEAEAIRADSPDVLLVRAQIKAAEGKLTELGRYLDGLEAYLAKTPDAGSGFALQVGELQRQAGRLEPGRRNLQKALGAPNLEEPTLVALVQLETAANELDQARGYLDRLKKKDTRADIVHELEGDLAMAAGKLDVAASQYESAAAAKSRGGVIKLARVRERQGNPAAGVATLQQWLEANPRDDAAALLLATMRIGAGDSVQARKEYEALLPRYGDNPVFINNLAWLYFDAKDPRAEDMARRAYALAPDDPDVNDTLGWILVHSDAPSASGEALELLEKSAAQHETPAVLYHLAMAQQKAGRTREARATVSRALKVENFPERSAAEQLAKTLEQG